MSYGVVRTDLMSGTADPACLVSAKYYVGTTATAIDNGNVVALDSLMSGEREVWKAVTPAASAAIGSIVLVATPESQKDERKHNLDEFRNEAGEVIRGYRLRSGNQFSVTADALTNGTSTAMAPGHIVELAAGTKLNVVTSATNGSTVVGKIVAVDVTSRYTYYVICVD